jgi:hypothetical protein
MAVSQCKDCLCPVLFYLLCTFVHVIGMCFPSGRKHPVMQYKYVYLNVRKHNFFKIWLFGVSYEFTDFKN